MSGEARLVVPPGAPMPSGLLQTPYKRSATCFCITTFLFWVALHLYTPILPVYIEASGASLAIVGLVVASYAIPQMLLRIPIGLLSDRLRRRKPLVVAGLIITAAGALWLGLADQPWPLFFARMTTGIGAATWVVLVIYFATYYPPDNQGKAIGIINFVQGSALVVASAAGGIIADLIGQQQTFLIAALIAVVALLPLMLSQENPPARLVAHTRRGASSAIINPVLITASIMGILLQFSVHGGLFAFTPIYATRIGASITDLGLITMINTGFSSLGALGALRTSTRFGHRSTVIFGGLLIAGSLLAVPLIDRVPVLMALQVAFGYGRGLLMTTLMTLSIRSVPAGYQATSVGVYQAVYSVGMLLGPLISGIIGENLGVSMVFSIAALPGFIIVALAFLPAFSRRTTV